MRYLPLLLLILSSSLVHGQILNAESLRKVTDTSGWSGSASVRFAHSKSVNTFYSVGSDIHVQYKMGKHLVLLKNQINFQKIDDQDFNDSGILHLRYNNRFAERWAWEVFGQAQYNNVSLIDFRGLFGAGHRFKATTSEKYKVYLGSLVMYEHEELNDMVTPIQRDVRLSSYLSFSFYPTDNISIVSTTYYQPRIDEFSDHRVSSETSIVVQIYKDLGLNISHWFIYDAFPAVGTPTSQYAISTGLTYSFD